MVEQPRLNKSHRICVSQHINMYYEMQEYILSTQYVQNATLTDHSTYVLIIICLN